MKTVTYSCPFVPAEWIAAHGLRPKRIIPSSGSSKIFYGSIEGVCPYARAFASEAGGFAETADFAPTVMTTVCDQMRRMGELVDADNGRNSFLMNVPSTWQTVSSHQLYRDEIMRLGRFLVGLGGESPSKEMLAHTMRQYDAARFRLREVRARLGGRSYSEAIARFHRSFPHDRSAGNPRAVQNGIPSPRPDGIPIAFVGGPLLAEQFGLFDLIEASGGSVVLDATGTGERTLPSPFDLREIGNDPFAVLADAYFGGIPDAFRRPNSLLYSWLKEKLVERGAGGLIFIRQTWCDTWHAEAVRMKEWSPLPFLLIDACEDLTAAGRTAQRVQAFLEMLR